MTIVDFIQRIHDRRWEEDDEPSEWGKSSGEVTFIEMAKELLQDGFSPEDALSLFGKCFHAVASEYGE